MPGAERRVRPNIQQMRPKTREDVGLRVAARRLTKRFLGSHTERKQMQLSRADQRVSAAGYELDNGHYRKLRHQDITSGWLEHQAKSSLYRTLQGSRIFTKIGRN